MIENQEQLAATLAYIAQWADKLEGMQQYELQTGNGLFPTLAAGPLSEIRQSLELARDYANREAAAPGPALENARQASQNDFATAALRNPQATADIS